MTLGLAAALAGRAGGRLTRPLVGGTAYLAELATEPTRTTATAAAAGRASVGIRVQLSLGISAFAVGITP